MMVFVQLLLSHVLTDFYFQPTSWVGDKVAKKHRSTKLYLHVLLAGALAYICCAQWQNWWLIPAIAIPHFVIDIWKLNMPEKTIYFVVDQGLHILHLFIVGSIMNQTGINLTMEPQLVQQLIIVAVGLLLITTPAGILIGKLTQEYRENLDETDRSVSLPKAGKLIGILERIFVFIAVMSGQFSVVGFLIGAKSILRYSDSKYVKNPVRMSEYVIIGTLMSFLFAVIVSATCKYFIEQIAA